MDKHFLALNGFEQTGIWPVNPNFFKDTDFLPSRTTDIELHATPTTPLENLQLVPSTADSQTTPKRNNNTSFENTQSTTIEVHKTPDKHNDQDLEFIQNPQDVPFSRNLQDVTNIIDLERPGCPWMSNVPTGTTQPKNILRKCFV